MWFNYCITYIRYSRLTHIHKYVAIAQECNLLLLLPSTGYTRSILPVQDVLGRARCAERREPNYLITYLREFMCCMTVTTPHHTPPTEHWVQYNSSDHVPLVWGRMMV